MNDACKKLAPEYVLAANGEIIPSVRFKEFTFQKGEVVQFKHLLPGPFKTPISDNELLGKWVKIGLDKLIGTIIDNYENPRKVRLNSSYTMEDLKDIWVATHEAEDLRDDEQRYSEIKR